MRYAPFVALLLLCCGGNNGFVYDASQPTSNDFAVGGDASQKPTDAAANQDSSPPLDAGAGYGPYNSAGPDTVTEYDDTVDPTGLDFAVHVYYPSSTGMHPVVVLAPGLQQPGSAYVSYAQRLASHSFVTIVTDDPGVLKSTSTVQSRLEYLVTTWLPAQNSSGKLAGKVDVAHVGLAGHSRGGEATLLAAENGLKGHVLAWVGLDPVDSTSAPEAVTTIGSIAIPLLFIGGGTTTSCSPAPQNYATLYAAAGSPAVSLTIVNASHTEFEDPATCKYCSLCTPMGTATATQVLAESVRYLTASFAYQLAGDKSVGATLAGAGTTLDTSAGLIQLVSK